MPIGAVRDVGTASTTGWVSAAATNQKANADDHHHPADKGPERQNEIEDHADRNEGNEPRKSVTPGEPAIHDSAIDRSSDAS